MPNKPALPTPGNRSAPGTCPLYPQRRHTGEPFGNHQRPLENCERQCPRN
jgi:hypothetical protein